METTNSSNMRENKWEKNFSGYQKKKEKKRTQKIATDDVYILFMSFKGSFQHFIHAQSSITSMSNLLIIAIAQFLTCLRGLAK